MDKRTIHTFFNKIKSTFYYQTIKRLLVLYLLFTLCRLAFYVYNYNFYSERTCSELLTIFIGGLKFDTTAIMYTNLIFLFLMLIPFKFRYNRYYQIITKYIYFITNGVALFANCVDIIYARFTMQRTTVAFFTEFSHGEKLGKIFLEAAATNWHLVIFYILLMVILVLSYGKRLDKSSVLIKKAYIYYPVITVLFALSVGLTVAGGRGGFNHSTRPITLSNAAAYIQAAIDVPLVLNTPFSIFRSMENEKLDRLTYFTDEKVTAELYTPIHTPGDSLQMNNMNVMVIILESFSKEYCGFYNKDLQQGNYKGYTPFLDSIADNGLTYQSSYANGWRSVDALASMFLSVPSIPQPFVLSAHFNNRIEALPRLLRNEGYQTAFFCGQPNTGMGFQAFCNQLGFEHFFGKDEYNNNNDYDGIWGIWDEEFLQFTAKKMSTLKEPFLSSVFTISSHHPFKVPDKYENKFEEGPLVIHKCIRYTDYALKQFFETASNEPWFDNTLFVLLADHTNEIFLPEYNNTAERFAIPIIFYKPDGSLKNYKPEVAQQIDIMPTVLGYLQYNKPYLAFGFDLNNSHNRFAVNYPNGIYQLYTDNYFMQFDGTKTTGLYELHKDLQQNLAEEKISIVDELEPKLKAFLQQYTNRMIDNQLTVNKNE